MSNVDVISLIPNVKAILDAYPTFSLLLILMSADFVTGLMVAFVSKSLSSTVSWLGMCRKAVILILWGVASSIEPVVGIPLGRLVAFTFYVTESLSIVENAAKLGVPVPQVLLDALIKMKTAARPVPLPMQQPPAVVETHIHTDRAAFDIQTKPSADSQKIIIEPEEAGKP